MIKRYSSAMDVMIQAALETHINNNLLYGFLETFDFVVNMYGNRIKW